MKSERERKKKKEKKEEKKRGKRKLIKSDELEIIKNLVLTHFFI